MFLLLFLPHTVVTVVCGTLSVVDGHLHRAIATGWGGPSARTCERDNQRDGRDASEDLTHAR